MILINIDNFDFNSYKRKSYFVILIKNSVNILPPINEPVEPASHLFIRCPFLDQIWYHVFRWLRSYLASLHRILLDLGEEKTHVCILVIILDITH